MLPKYLSYVPTIDGLRALAVILVLMFHVDLGPFSGGYVGVDVFFVISGYLITGIILRELEKDSFNYKGFLLKRIARLHPALIATLILTMAAGFLILSPSDYMELGRATTAAFFSFSNILFWQKAGYFDESSETNPLLHTWSLGVESQFYLFWPLIILCVYRFGTRFVLSVVILFFIVSLAASQWFTFIDPSANYFLVPFRIFEFCCGALMVWLGRPRSSFIRELFMALGLLLIIYSGLTYDVNTAFPGFNALIPVAGAALCIYASNATMFGALLRNRLVVYIGLISYSIYLVHWPLLVLYKYYVFRPLFLGDKVLILIICVVLSTALHGLVENKYRRVNLGNLSRPGRIAALSVMVVCVLPAVLVVENDGFMFRIKESFQQRAANEADHHTKEFGGAGVPEGNFGLGYGTPQQPGALLLGDSFARQYAGAFDKLLREERIHMHASFRDGCYFSPGYTRFKSGRPVIECSKQLDYALSYLQQHPNIPLIMAIIWQGYRNGISSIEGSRVEFNAQLEYTNFIIDGIQQILNRIGDRKLILIGLPPGIGTTTNLASCIERPNYLPLNCLRRITLEKKQGYGRELNAALKHLSNSDSRVLFLNPYDALCNQTQCRSIMEGEFIYSDAIHLSKHGASVVTNFFRTTLIDNLKKYPTEVLE